MAGAYFHPYVVKISFEQRDFHPFLKQWGEGEIPKVNGVKIKVPDVLSDEFCDVCGKQMVVKKGKFGHFLACGKPAEIQNNALVQEAYLGVKKEDK